MKLCKDMLKTYEKVDFQQSIIQETVCFISFFFTLTFHCNFLAQNYSHGMVQYISEILSEHSKII